MHRPCHDATWPEDAAEPDAAAGTAVHPGEAAPHPGDAIEPTAQDFRLCPPAIPTEESAAGRHQPTARSIAPARAAILDATQPITVRLHTNASSFAPPLALQASERLQPAQAVRVTSASGGTAAAAMPMFDEAHATASNAGRSLAPATQQQPMRPAAAANERSDDGAEDAAPIGPGGGAALMHQPDGVRQLHMRSNFCCLASYVRGRQLLHSASKTHTSRDQTSFANCRHHCPGAADLGGGGCGEQPAGRTPAASAAFRVCLPGQLYETTAMYSHAGALLCCAGVVKGSKTIGPIAGWCSPVTKHRNPNSRHFAHRVRTANLRALSSRVMRPRSAASCRTLTTGSAALHRRQTIPTGGPSSDRLQ